jgi:prepilin-type N-terminal cleavage/methylation domain-containing protein
MNKIKAFTLIELIVVMLIGTIVVVFLWTGYEFINKNYSRWTGKNQQVLDLIGFERLFRKDIRNSAVVKMGHNYFSLTGDLENIEYHFLSNVVVRKANDQADTIRCDVASYEVTYLNEECNNEKFICEINMITRLNGKEVSLSFCKDYDAKFLYRILIDKN